MKVSIIVPVYNVENVLHYCVDSILNQTYKDFKLILVNDGSTDNSGKICDKYAKNNDKVSVIHLENGGVSRARNIGIEHAKGEYICFIDSDDYVAENYLEELVKIKEQHPDFDSIWCGFQTVCDYSGANSNVFLAAEETMLSIYDRSDIMTLHEKWLSQMPWNKLFISDIIKKNNICFYEDLSLGEDLIFVLHYLDASNGKIAVINKPLNYYIRSGDESLDNKFYPNMFEVYKLINSEIYNCLTMWKCDESQIALFYNSCFYSYEKVLRNTFRENSTIKNKYKYNKQIMKRTEFKEALEKSDCNINRLYLFGYRIASYRFIRFLDYLVKLI